MKRNGKVMDMDGNFLPKGEKTIDTVVVFREYDLEHPSRAISYPAIAEIELLESDGWKEGDTVRITVEKI